MSPPSQINTIDSRQTVLPDFSLLNLTVLPASVTYSHMSQPYSDLSLCPIYPALNLNFRLPHMFSHYSV
ncbi:MAG: hypothetical protein OCD01_14280 [Fibrobacterales bacterium]